MRIINPFLTKGYLSPNYFCDREKETKTIQEALYNGRNITLISIRRMGKTALIHHSYYTFPDKNLYYFIYFDIYPTNNLEDFTTAFANALVKMGFTKNKGFLKKVIDFVSKMGASLNFDTSTGAPSVELVYNKKNKPAWNLEELFNWVNALDKNVFIAVDEFQKIQYYPEKNIEAILRTFIQKMNNCTFLYAGSHKTMMQNMFLSYKQPFYQSTEILYLNEIPEPDYVKFISRKFSEKNIVVSNDDLKFILGWCRNNTYPVQYVCNKIYSQSPGVWVQKDLQKLVDALLDENEMTYYGYQNLLTQLQWRILAAIAKENSVSKPTSSAFLKKYNLPASSSVVRAINSLLEKELILQLNDGLIVYDVFFSRWLEKN